MRHLKYKGWSIDYNPKPIPQRFSCDYDVMIDDYAGENFDEDGNELAFSCGSVELAKSYIDDMESLEAAQCDDGEARRRGEL